MAQEYRSVYDEARRFARVAFSGRIVCRYASDDEGAALLCDVSRGGLRISLGRYLRPGTRIMLGSDGVRVNGQPIELKGLIVWCAQEKRGQRFAAGVRVIYDEPDAVATASALVNHALCSSGIMEELLDRTLPAGGPAPVWPVRAVGNGARAAAGRFVAGNA